jgi:hypothetical protein
MSRFGQPLSTSVIQAAPLPSSVTSRYPVDADAWRRGPTQWFHTHSPELGRSAAPPDIYSTTQLTTGPISAQTEVKRTNKLGYTRTVIACGKFFHPCCCCHSPSTLQLLTPLCSVYTSPLPKTENTMCALLYRRSSTNQKDGNPAKPVCRLRTPEATMRLPSRRPCYGNLSVHWQSRNKHRFFFSCTIPNHCG